MINTAVDDETLGQMIVNFMKSCDSKLSNSKTNNRYGI